MSIKQQKQGENYHIYNGDCVEVCQDLPDNIVDFSIYSPPFAGLYNYSSDYRDMSNCESPEQFLTQYGYLVKEMARLTKSGRINAVHCTEVVENNGDAWDFPHEIIRLHKEAGFQYKGRITIWKEPLKVRMNTMVKSLMHKLIVEDASQCFPAQPDYLLLFKKKGDAEQPVVHATGMNEYFGDTPILPHMLKAWNNANGTSFNESELWDHLKASNDLDKVTKLNHYVWQRYASSIWDDIRVSNVLPFKGAKTEEDEKHVHPLQLDVIDRGVQLWSNKGDVCFTPFMGVGSEVYSPVSMGRKGIGVELKDSYFNQAVKNVESASNRFSTVEQLNLF